MADPVVLVTGAKGQVGSAITRLASTMQVKVIALGSSELDIGNRDDIERSLDLYTPDVLINAAAYTAVDRAELEPELAYRVNATGAANLAATAVARNMPLIHLSTDYVFDGTKTSPYLESDPACPIGVYGASKLAGEEAVQSAGGGQWIIVRTSWVFGLEGHNFPKTIMRLAAEREQLGVVADQRGCPTFADDIARAVLALSQPECRCGGGGQRHISLCWYPGCNMACICHRTR